VDVTDPEPLPADHPLWQQPDVMVYLTHRGAVSARVAAGAAALQRQRRPVAAGLLMPATSSIKPEAYDRCIAPGVGKAAARRRVNRENRKANGRWGDRDVSQTAQSISFFTFARETT
jgi:hypothetical protein